MKKTKTKERVGWGILKFPLPEEDFNFNIASKAMDWALTVWDLEQFLRTKIKYGNLPSKESKVYEDIRQELYSILDGRGLSMEEII